MDPVIKRFILLYNMQIYEMQQEKMYQQICTPSKDSDQPGYSYSLIESVMGSVSKDN